MYHILKRFAGIVCVCMCVVLATGNAVADMTCADTWTKVSFCNPNNYHMAYADGAKSYAEEYWQVCPTGTTTGCICDYYRHATECYDGYYVAEEFAEQTCPDELIHVDSCQQCTVVTSSNGPWTSTGTDGYEQQLVTRVWDHGNACGTKPADGYNYRCAQNYYGSPSSGSSGCSPCTSVEYEVNCTISNATSAKKTCHYTATMNAGSTSSSDCKSGVCDDSTCHVVSCDAGFFKQNNTTCASCAVGTYTGAGNTASACSACTNKPASNSHYTTNGTTATNCDWGCEASYYKNGSSCSSCAVGTWSAADATSCSACTNKPSVNAHYTTNGTATDNCEWECDDGYIENGNGTACIAPSCNDGEYFTGNGCVACTNGPENSSYTGSASSNSCPWQCNAGYYNTGNSCASCTSATFTTSNGCNVEHGTATRTCHYTGGNAGTNGVSQCTQGYTNCGSCTLQSCNNGYYKSGSTCSACTNGPANSYYTGSATSNSCPWVCNAGFSGSSANGDIECEAAETCHKLACSSDAECVAAGFGYCSDNCCDGSAPAASNFQITVRSSGAFYFGFFTSAGTGTIYVDWGDGSAVQSINPYNVSDSNPATHSYTGGGPYTITMTPGTTPLSSSGDKAIYFKSNYADFNQYIRSISGSLSAIFPQSSSPNFRQAFMGATNLTSVSPNLFSGYTGMASMFSQMFQGCTSLNNIPAGLFSGINGNHTSLFSNTFQGCTGLTSIPSGLFGNITTSANYMFNRTFYGCTGLTSLPAGLFYTIPSAADHLFSETFRDCSNMGTGDITYIPQTTFATLIANNSPTASYMWNYTFTGTQLVTQCPAGMSQFITNYEGSNYATTWNGKVSCTKCPKAPGVYTDSGKTTLVIPTSVSGNNTNRTQCYIPQDSGYYDITGHFTWTSGSSCYYSTE